MEIPNDCLGSVMENLSGRKAQITNMNHVGNQVSVEALVPMRGLIGFETDLVNMTKGMGVMSHLFHEYGPDCGEIAARKNGSLVSMDAGEATSYALNMVQERGRLMVEPGDDDLRRHDRRRKRARKRHSGQSREGKAPDQHAFARRRQGHRSSRRR